MNDYWIQVATALAWMGLLALAVWLVVKRTPDLGNPPKGLLRASPEGVAVKTPDGRIAELRWPDLERVTIRTTGRGPSENDAVWCFQVVDDAGELTVANDADGIDAFLGAVDEWLPDFDHEVVIAAMDSKESREFVVWSRSD